MLVFDAILAILIIYAFVTEQLPKFRAALATGETTAELDKTLEQFSLSVVEITFGLVILIILGLLFNLILTAGAIVIGCIASYIWTIKYNRKYPKVETESNDSDNSSTEAAV